jgi:glycosyltransferase involved in cell wall biosynthesis
MEWSKKAQYNVKVFHDAPRRELISLYRVADIVVVPSIMYEGFPYTLLDALALGKPVVLSSMLGLEELVDDSGVIHGENRNQLQQWN